MKKGVVIIQDKNYSSKLPTKEVQKVIARFKELYSDFENHPTRDVIGFELNGGEGMTRPGVAEWNEFENWCNNRGLDCEYNTDEDIVTIRDVLRYRESIKNKY